MFRVLILQRLRRIDKKRAPYVLIGAGIVYLVAFNTVLRDLDVWYFGFLLLVVALCGRFLLRRPRPTVVYLHGHRALAAGKSSLPVALVIKKGN
jgi:hypothetical protein